MSFHRLLPSISFLKSDRRISAGSPHPLGATWDGRGTNFALFSSDRREGRALPVRQDRAERDRPRRAAGAHRGRLARLSALRPARPALRLSGSRSLRSGGRTPLQSPQAADRSLQQAARRPVRLDRRASRLSRRPQARGPVVRPPRQRALDVQIGGGRPGPHPGATTGIRRCRGKTPSSTRRMSKA